MSPRLSGASMSFDFATAGRILFGRGQLAQAGSIARSLGSRALVVTGRSGARADRMLALLDAARVPSEQFGVDGEPTVEAVRRGADIARRAGCDVVIALGGGSAIDAGKAIAALAANDGDVLEYLEVIGQGRPLTHTPLPCVAIPTTGGTGSEVTRNAVLASPEHRMKASLRHPAMLPRTAIVDPDLTLSVPPDVTAASGLDALTQLIEAYLTRRANPLTDALCLDAIPRAAVALPTAVRDGGHREARDAMALAALFSGLALANAGLGAVHGLAGPLGGMFSAPHGALCAVLVPHVLRANLTAARRLEHLALCARLDTVAQLITGRTTARAEDGVQWLRDLVLECRIPTLRTYGITAGHVPEIVERARRASSMQGNPVELTTDELSRIVEDAR
jgi:alcohol dehydrogenase class IV